MPTMVLVTWVHSSITMQKANVVSWRNSESFINQVPSFFLSSGPECFSVSTAEQMANLFKIVINFIEPPHGLMALLNTAWKRELHSLLVIKIMTATRYVYRKCLIWRANILSFVDVLHPLALVHRLGDFADMDSNLLFNIKGKWSLHWLLMIY